MAVRHTTTVHAQCPNGGWDYYEVRFEPDQFYLCEDFETACDSVRGQETFQEKLAEDLSKSLPDGKLSVIGRHGNNTATEVYI